MQTVAHSAAAGLSARIRPSSGLKASSPARAVRFCRTFKSPIAYKDDEAEVSLWMESSKAALSCAKTLPASGCFVLRLDRG